MFKILLTPVLVLTLAISSYAALPVQAQSTPSTVDGTQLSNQPNIDGQEAAPAVSAASTTDTSRWLWLAIPGIALLAIGLLSRFFGRGGDDHRFSSTPSLAGLKGGAISRHRQDNDYYVDSLNHQRTLRDQERRLRSVYDTKD